MILLLLRQLRIEDGWFTNEKSPSHRCLWEINMSKDESEIVYKL